MYRFALCARASTHVHHQLSQGVIIMRKFQQLKTVATIATPKGTLVVQDYYPSKPHDKKWREYVLHCAGFVGGASIVATSEEARNKWVQAQGIAVQQSLFA
jgi:hypothetical protein